ncbi:MAG TPA: DUF2244 domain-containing protein [Salinisphaeraceae bacterium]|nr:DUF2244 domain-containing protein [Salinisphaeraceae bacterium]
MPSQVSSSGPARRLVIAPNASLSVAYAQWFFVVMCAFGIIIGGILTWRGLWLVWPFVGLELGLLALGLYLSMRNNNYREVVSVYEDVIEVDAGRGRPERHWEFPRLLTQVQLEPGQARNSPTRLLVTRYGKGCELGRCLTDEEREDVAARLRSWVRTPELVSE